MGNYEMKGMFDTRKQAIEFMDSIYKPGEEYHLIQNRRGYWIVVVET